MTNPDESHVWSEMDALNSIVLSTLDACSTIQFLCHMISLPHYSLRLPAYEHLSSWIRGLGEIRLQRV